MSVDFTGLPIATLLELQASFAECLKQIAIVGQNYSIGGRSFGFANLSEVSKTLMDINSAILRKNGRGATRTFVNLRQRN